MNSDASSASSESTDINYSLIGSNGEPVEFKTLTVLSEGKHCISGWQFYLCGCWLLSYPNLISGDQTFSASVAGGSDFDVAFSDLSVLKVDGSVCRCVTISDSDGKLQYHVLAASQEKELLQDHVSGFPGVKLDWAGWLKLSKELTRNPDQPLPPKLAPVFGKHIFSAQLLEMVEAEKKNDDKKKREKRQEAAKRRQHATHTKKPNGVHEDTALSAPIQAPPSDRPTKRQKTADPERLDVKVDPSVPSDSIPAHVPAAPKISFQVSLSDMTVSQAHFMSRELAGSLARLAGQ
jgi:hypothetical protein